MYNGILNLQKWKAAILRWTIRMCRLKLLIFFRKPTILWGWQWKKFDRHLGYENKVSEILRYGFKSNRREQQFRSVAWTTRLIWNDDGFEWDSGCPVLSMIFYFHWACKSICYYKSIFVEAKLAVRTISIIAWFPIPTHASYYKLL